MSRNPYSSFDPNLPSVVILNTHIMSFYNDEDSSIREEGEYVGSIWKGMLCNEKDLYDLCRGDIPEKDVYIETYNVDTYRIRIQASFTDEDGYECLRSITYVKIVRNT